MAKKAKKREQVMKNDWRTGVSHFPSQGLEWDKFIMLIHIIYIRKVRWPRRIRTTVQIQIVLGLWSITRQTLLHSMTSKKNNTILEKTA